jgi:hypothetical protein
MHRTRGKHRRRSTSKRLRLVAVAGAAFMAFALLMPSAVAVVAGAGYTTTNAAVDGPGTCFNGPGVVNCNIYEEKEHVWISGGPTNGTSALSDGTYFFVVGVPGGENSDINDAATVPDDGTGTPKNLSDDFDAYTNRTFTVVNNQIATYGGTHTSYDTGSELLIRLFPYSDTTNPGGEYFVGICRIDTPATAGYPAEPSQCKYDNFKVKEGDGTVVEFGVVSGLKYYDANTNGQWDAGEPGLRNWPIDFTDGVANTVLTDNTGAFSVNLSPDVYTFQEEQANSPWMQTGNTVDQTSSSGGNSASLANFIYTVTVTDTGITTGLNFGNVCLGAGGGHTLGFWSNKNGQAQMNDGGSVASELALLSSLNLRNANGTNFDPANYAAFKNWLLSASATNMAYMLSAQLAAMQLNVEAGFVSGTALVWNGSAFVTINSVMADANALLANPIAGGTFAGQNGGLTVGASALRTAQEGLKNTLDAGNNNLNFVQPTPQTCPTPVFP